MNEMKFCTYCEKPIKSAVPYTDAPRFRIGKLMFGIEEEHGPDGLDRYKALEFCTRACRAAAYEEMAAGVRQIRHEEYPAKERNERREARLEAERKAREELQKAEQERAVRIRAMTELLRPTE